jgi:predicted  nucleic acid-binding Zn-ribbon protein
MSELIIQLALPAATGILAGALAAWLLRGGQAAREMEAAEGDWQRKLDQAINKARVLDDQATSLKVNLENTQRLALQNKHAAVSKSTELESLSEKTRSLTKEFCRVRSERDEYANRSEQQQRYISAARKRMAELNREFANSREFYKKQLESAVEQRHALERKIDSLRSEQASPASLLRAARLEQDSLNRMLSSSGAQLEKLDELENKAIALEAENAELRHSLDSAVRESNLLRQEIARLDDLEAQNQELARRLESMETSHRPYESDARRCHEQTDQLETETHTLRLRLGDIEKNFSAMQREQEKAEEITGFPTMGEDRPPEGEEEDLTEIIRIG